MAVIETHELSRNFGQFKAVSDLNLTVEEGEVLGFLGPNGAGKTTTIRMLAGIIAPTSGSCSVAGVSPDREPERLHELIGLLTESPGFYARLSARRNLEFFAGFYPIVNVAGQVTKYLKIMGLWDRRDDPVGKYSKGMKQRLALARALVHEPGVLFLDEPTAGLDPEAAREVRDLIKSLSSQGRTIFLSTHNLAEAEMLCRRIAIIHTRLLALDTAGALRQRFVRRGVTVQLSDVSAGLVARIEKLPFAGEVRLEGDRLHVQLADPGTQTPELVQAVVNAGGKILTVSEENPTLEEVYLSLVRQERNA